MVALAAVVLLTAALHLRHRPQQDAAAQRALFWNMSAVNAVGPLSYDEQVSAFAAQGLFNRREEQHALLFFDIGEKNYDWPHADAYWIKTLTQNSRVSFSPLEPSLCSLFTATSEATSGLVVYNGDGPGTPISPAYGDGFSAAIALTYAGQQRLLPVSAALLEKHPCLKSMKVSVDLRKTLKGMSRPQAWDFAITTLLPHSSKSTVFNLNHYRVGNDPTGFKHDKQSQATASSIDYIVQQRAFVLDLESHAADGGTTAVRDHDDDLIDRVFSQLDPLFDAYGWADDEFSWTNETSVGGGTIMCSFASPNLSFWHLLRLVGGASRARKLPVRDRGMALDKSKYYVTFETNEGDTPRILVSAMASAWAQPERGSLPVAWAIDPLLAERFPALFDYFVTTASANDSFIAGTAGAGYAFLNQMSDIQLNAYAKRTALLTARYGPRIIDTYGYANLSVHTRYAKAAAAAMPGGVGAPAAFVTQPNGGQRSTEPYNPWNCTAEGRTGNQLVPGLPQETPTPLICTSGNPKLFYYSGGLESSCPSCDLAQRIKTVAKKYPPPYFILVYGGLQAFGGVEDKSKKNFFTLLTDTVHKLGDGFVAVGADEMARLSKQALAPFAPARV